jgi:uncharacterized protein (DUF4415 family)
VRFSWDPRKSEANLAARGFDFEFAGVIFEGPTLEKADDRKDYGERRVLAIGLAHGLHLTVAYTDRHAPDREIERRIISARRSIAVSAKRMAKPSPRADAPKRGRADLARLRRMGEQEIERTSPPELTDLPEDFWADAEVVVAPLKQAISLRVDQDVLNWFREQGPRYQTRINAVLRAYVSQAKGVRRSGRIVRSKASHRRDGVR